MKSRRELESDSFVTAEDAAVSNRVDLAGMQEFLGGDGPGFAVVSIDYLPQTKDLSHWRIARTRIGLKPRSGCML